MRRVLPLLAILLFPVANASLEPNDLHPGVGITNTPGCHSEVAVLFEFQPTGASWQGRGVLTGASACGAFRAELSCQPRRDGAWCVDEHGANNYSTLDYQPAARSFLYYHQDGAFLERASGRML